MHDVINTFIILFAVLFDPECTFVLSIHSQPYICMYACMYVCMYACMCVCMHVSMYVWLYVCIDCKNNNINLTKSFVKGECCVSL